MSDNLTHYAQEKEKQIQKLLDNIEEQNRLYNESQQRITELESRFLKDCDVCGGRGFTQHKTGISPINDEPTYETKPCHNLRCENGKVPREILLDEAALIFENILRSSYDDYEGEIYSFAIEPRKKMRLYCENKEKPILELTRIDSDIWEVLLNG